MGKNDYKVKSLKESPIEYEKFRKNGFDIISDLKELKLMDYYKDIMTQLIIELRNKYPPITQSGDFNVKKIRAENPLSVKGKSSGLRIVCLIDELNRVAVPFHIFPKDGSKRKDNLTTTQKNRIKEIVKIAAIERENKK